MVLAFLVKLRSRLILWFKVLKNFRGLSLSSWFCLWISAFVDILLYAFSSTGFNPRLVFKGLFFYKVKRLGIIVVRGGTDDFYCAIPGREGDVDEFIRSCLSRGSVFIDVGANIGYYTLVASKLVGSSGRIHAIEPVPSTAAILRANIKLNNCSNVFVHDVAAWSSKGKLVLRIPKSWYGSASFLCNGMSVTVNATTLDELLQSEDSVSCMKIDVEGAELEVLRGAKNILQKTKYLILELSYNVNEILRKLQEAGFKCIKAHFTTYVICVQTKTSNNRTSFYSEDRVFQPYKCNVRNANHEC
jgi:FkbM family methyltransferase